MKKCFIISPIGEDGSDVRKQADLVLKHIIKPITNELGYETKRADEEMYPNVISKSIVQNIVEADLVIADLSLHNPNVFYELAIRHTIGKPVVQIIKKGEILPFDISQIRTIVYDLELDAVDECKHQLKEYILGIENMNIVDNPIMDVIKLNGLSNVKTDDVSVDNAISQLANEIKRLPEYLNDMENRLLGRFIQSVQQLSNPSFASDKSLSTEEKLGMMAMDKLLSNPSIGNRLFEEIIMKGMNQNNQK